MDFKAIVEEEISERSFIESVPASQTPPPTIMK
jgi:hypothetical protein